MTMFESIGTAWIGHVHGNLYLDRNILGLFGLAPPHCRVSLKVVRAFKKPIPLKLMARI